ncbi:MAG: hypothetical protein R2742_00110 [Micropruina glycogenica]
MTTRQLSVVSGLQRRSVSRLVLRLKSDGLVRIAAAVTRPLDLGGPLGVTRSGVAYVVDQLCAKGLIARHTGEVPGAIVGPSC